MSLGIYAIILAFLVKVRYEARYLLVYPSVESEREKIS